MLKNLYKNTSKNLTKLSLALRGLIGTLAGAAYVQEDVRLAFWFLVAGAILDFIIQLLPPDTEIKPGAKVLVVMFLLSLLCFSGCRTVRPEVSRLEVKDSTIVNYKTVDVPLPDFSIRQGINIDSLLKSLAPAVTKGGGAKNEASQPIIIKDDRGKVQLQYWMDEFGKLQVSCESKDQTVQLLVAENVRLRQETRTVVQREFKTPTWNYIIIIMLGLTLVLSLLKR